MPHNTIGKNVTNFNDNCVINWCFSANYG